MDTGLLDTWPPLAAPVPPARSQHMLAGKAMGLVWSWLATVDEKKKISKQIDKEILQELKQEADEIDLLLLGAAESGKSTILKQMRIIHKADYGLEERIMFKPIVYANTIHSMSLILHAVERLGIELDSEESEYDAYVFYQLLEEQTSHMHALVEDIKVTRELSRVVARLWKDQGIQGAFLRWDGCPQMGLGVGRNQEFIDGTCKKDTPTAK